jgi:UDP-N-acetyl-D-mannosaminuronic acid dehydrogenase
MSGSLHDLHGLQPQRATASAPVARRRPGPMVDPDLGLPAPDLDLVVLGGGGHVGLPLSLAFCAAGLRVGIYDTSAATLERISRGEVPFVENGAPELLAELLPTGRLVLGTEAEMLRRSDSVVVVIGTPVDEFLHPSMTVFEQTVDQIARDLRPGALVVLRSTVYPGTTARVAEDLEARGCDVDVAFCPERIAEGHALEELSSLPQIVGADTERAGDRAEALFRILAAKTIRTSTREAELAKLFTNTWRYIKFAVANQFFMIAHTAGVDYGNVLNAIRQDYPRARDLPGPGFAAGPCLFKDCMQLAAFTSDHFPLGQAAMQINEGLPAYVVAALERRYGTLRDRTVGILGMAFKAESDDIRASLSYKLRKLLHWSGAEVLCTDPYVRDERLWPLDEVVRRSEILILGAPHREYQGLDVQGKDVVDVWGAMGRGIAL